MSRVNSGDLEQGEALPDPGAVVGEELAAINGEMRRELEAIESADPGRASFLLSLDMAKVLLDSDSLVRHFTPSAARLFDLLPGDVGRPLGDITLRFDDPALHDDLRETLDRATVSQREVRTESGHWYLRRIRPIKPLVSGPGGAVLTFVDITPNKQAETALRGLSDSLVQRGGAGLGVSIEQAVFDALPGSVCVLGQNGRVLAMNEAWRVFAEEHGITLQAVGEGQDFLAASPPEVLSEVARRIQAGVRAVLVGSDTEYSFEYPCRQPGRLCWFMLRVTGFTHADGRGAVIAHIDVTERRLAEEELHAERNFVSAVFQTMPALLVVADLEGRILRYNKACERVAGYSCEEMYGESLLERLVPQEERAAVGALMDSLRAGQHPLELECHWQRCDGERRLIAWNATVLTDEVGKVKYLVGTGVDITEQRQAEGQARRRLEELAHANRLQTAGELATMMAHELNQPLGAISSYSAAALQLLQQEAPDKARLLHNMEQIERQALRAGRAIKQLREFVSRGKIDPVPCDLNAIVRNVQELMTPKLRANSVAISLDLSADLAPVLAVDVQVEQVLINLIRNSTDAIRDAGMPAGSVVIQTRTAGDLAEISVLDSGPGVELDQIERLFDPFFTSKSYGLGVGLRISRSLVEAHGGRLWAEPGSPGGRFHFTLPFTQ